MKSRPSRIYRIQKKLGRRKFGLGPYRPQDYDGFTLAWSRHRDDDVRPSWHRETGENPTKATWFGFRSLEQLYAWFDEEDCLDDLRGRGYYIAVFEGFVVHGSKQSVIFVNKPSRLVKTLEL